MPLTFAMTHKISEATIIPISLLTVVQEYNTESAQIKIL